MVVIMVDTFSTSDEFSKSSLNTYFQRRQIESPIQNLDSFVTVSFSILVRPDILVQQSFCFADAVLKSSIDPRKLFNSHSLRNENFRITLAKVYIYSFFKGYYLGLEYSNINFETNDNLILRGHGQLFELLRAKTFTTSSPEYGECIRRLEVTNSDRALNDQAYNMFSQWLNAKSNIGSLLSFEQISFESILFNLKTLAKNNGTKQIGLDYWIDSVNVLSSKVINPDSCYLGNCCYARLKTPTINMIMSHDLKIFKPSQIINTGLFITLTSEYYGNGSILNHSVYTQIDFSQSLHARKFEVESITGMKCNATLPINSDEFGTLINNYKPLDTEGQSSGNRSNP
jgi:hypothetical protein